MKPKSVGILAVVTLIAVMAATMAVWLRPGVTTLTGDDAPAFPRLRAEPGAAVRITIADAEGSVSLSRDGEDGWFLPDKDGFPADPAKVRSLIAGLADMRLAEAKTARPDRFPRLEVEDLDAPEAQSRKITVSAGDSRVLAEALIGRRAYGVTGGREAGTYIRRTGDDHAWLAGGTVDVPTNAGAWLRQEVVHVPADRVKKVSVTSPDGERYRADRNAADADLRLRTVPEERTAEAAAVRQLAAVLTLIELVDVAAAEDFVLPDEAASVTVETFDGLRIGYRLAIVDDLPWATFSTEPQADAPATVVDEARNIADRVDGWVFRMHRSVADRMAPSLESLLEPPASDS